MLASTAPRQVARHRPRIGVVKFASCDGCQLTLLDLEDDLLAIADRVDIVEFAEATSNRSSGPFDILFVEGSISTLEQAEEIVRLREAATTLVTIGACATSGGIQALRNWADHDAIRSLVYPRPDYVESLATATPIADHVAVDAELRGCPISPDQLREFVTATLVRRRPNLPDEALCARVQAAWRGVRGGRRWRHLPRPHHQERLWRSVPSVRTGVLRLLRATRGGQRPGPRCLAWTHERRRRHRSRIRPVQRLGAAVPERHRRRGRPPRPHRRVATKGATRCMTPSWPRAAAISPSTCAT